MRRLAGMSRTQRLIFLAVAAAIAVIAVVILAVAGVGSDDQAVVTPTATATTEPQQASPGATETPSATPTADPGPLLTGVKEQSIDVQEGDTVAFRVKATEDEVVHVHGYDIEKTVPAGETVRISFPARITGIFEIEFHHSGAVLARLKVEPG